MYLFACSLNILFLGLFGGTCFLKDSFGLAFFGLVFLLVFSRPLFGMVSLNWRDLSFPLVFELLKEKMALEGINLI